VPELPDVELARRTLEEAARGRRFEGVEVEEPGLLADGLDPVALEEAVAGATLAGTRRRGKQLFGGLEDGPWLRFHFGMSGFLAWWDEGGEPSEYPYVVFGLEGGRRLAFDCRRKLGEIELVDDPDAWAADHGLGPDVLELGADGFLEAMDGKRGMVKTALMDQSRVAGVGNEFSDEILFQARLHPRTKMPDLSPEERRDLYGLLRETLTTAIDRGMEADALPDGWILPVREEGADCPRCGGAIERIEISGRGCYLCPACQPAPGEG
jgi:formamidopyrimidine-DNA glycosylase